MAHRSAKGERLESPYHYAKNLNEKVLSQLSEELVELSGSSDSS
jgi:hypothetical protein